MSSRNNIALFPLETVLFPNSYLPLKIFEPRYTDLVSACLKNETQFGICLLRDNAEYDDCVEVHQVGTRCDIVDWNMGTDGILRIIVKGVERFNILDFELKPNKLLTANVEHYCDYFEQTVPKQYRRLIDVCQRYMSNSKKSTMESSFDLEDSAALGYRLSELLPIKNSQRQYLLQLTDPISRLQVLSNILEDMSVTN